MKFALTLIIALLAITLGFTQQILEPRPGDTLRTNILDGIRVVVQKPSQPKVVFMVSNMVTVGDHAIVQCVPQNPGHAKEEFFYETNTFFFGLKKSGGSWKYQWHFGQSNDGGTAILYDFSVIVADRVFVRLYQYLSKKRAMESFPKLSNPNHRFFGFSASGTNWSGNRESDFKQFIRGRSYMFFSPGNAEWRQGTDPHTALTLESLFARSFRAGEIEALREITQSQ